MTHPLPKPPPCPPDPWPLIGKAWQEMQAFREMLWQVLLDMSMTDPQFTALLQNLVINALIQDPRIYKILQDMTTGIVVNSDEIKQIIMTSPRIGVTDGSDAQPGQVGEFIHFEQTIDYAAYPATTTQTTTLGVLPAGDWDCRMSIAFDTTFGVVAFFFDPLPPGLSHPMTGGFGTTGTIGATLVQMESMGTLLSTPARASFPVPTPLPLYWLVDQEFATYLPAGHGYIVFEARRMR